MPATFSLDVLTCSDCELSKLARLLLSSGWYWERDVATGEYLYEKGAQLRDLGDADTASTNIEDSLDIVDTAVRDGMVAAILLSRDRGYSIRLAKEDDSTFRIQVGDSRPIIQGGWLTDATAVYRDILVPLVSGGICLLSVQSQDENL